jgi:hypothetical protein
MRKRSERIKIWPSRCRTSWFVEVGTKEISHERERRSSRVKGRFGGEIWRRTFCSGGGEKGSIEKESHSKETKNSERGKGGKERTRGFMVKRSSVRSASSLISMSLSGETSLVGGSGEVGGGGGRSSLC